MILFIGGLATNYQPLTTRDYASGPDAPLDTPLTLHLRAL